jgi:xylose isomerase
MNEDVFNTSLRGFLKKVGITSQREIEIAVRDAVAAGRLKGHEKLLAKMVLTLGGVDLTHEISAEIELG